jgi:hypothetical protein
MHLSYQEAEDCSMRVFACESTTSAWYLMSCPKFPFLMKLELFACAAGPVLSRAEQDVE